MGVVLFWQFRCAKNDEFCALPFLFTVYFAKIYLNFEIVYMYIFCIIRVMEIASRFAGRLRLTL